jgi:hypothetical protein
MTPEQIEAGDYKWWELAEYLGYETKRDHGRIGQAYRKEGESTWKRFSMFKPYGNSDTDWLLKHMPEDFQAKLEYSQRFDDWTCSLVDSDLEQEGEARSKKMFHAAFAAYVRFMEQ